MNTNYFQRVFFIVLLLTISLQTNATHIVGGEVNYKCLGNDLYEITMTVFRDCQFGIPNFDDPAHIGIFDSNNELVSEIAFQGVLDMDYILDDTLDPTLFNPCLTIPPDVCVDKTTYVETVTLPFRAGGYQIVYQRCCRNNTIVNIINPDDTGATYGILITEQAMLECNSNAVFNEWPPTYICVNEPILFDHSATDQEGDSLVYKICKPFDGAEMESCIPPNTQVPCFDPLQPCGPIPCPPFNPPFDYVVWQPPYDLNNVMGGIPLAIDSETGLLTGTPNVIGQFVVGVCVEEYRNGVLISTTIRDFQFNVGVCGQTISSFFAPSVICDNALTVSTDNQSDNADIFEWYFNDPLYPDSVNTEISPDFTYSDTGAYTIMLIAEPGNVCVDTFLFDIQLNLESLGVDFEFDFTECTDTMTIQATDLSTDSLSPPANWDWTLTNQNGTTLGTSTDQNPTFTLGNSDIVTMQLIVTAQNGCIDSIEETFEVSVIEEELFPDTIAFCDVDSVQLNTTSTMDYVYFWTPPFNLSDVNAPSPWASPPVTTTYSVIITDSIGFCEVIRDVTVVVPPEIGLEMPSDTTVCDTNVELIASSDFGVAYNWATDPEITDIFATQANTIVTPIGENTYYLEVIDIYGCSDIDSVTIIGNGVNVTTLTQPIICDGESTEVTVTNLDPVDILTYDWSPALYVLSGINNATATVQPPAPGTYPFYVSIENQFGCTGLDSVLVAVLDTTSQAAFVSDQQCSGYSIQFTNTSINASYILWDFGDPSNPGATSTETNPEYTYPGPGIYTVTLTIDAAVNCPDTISAEIEVFEPEIVVDFDWAYEPCSDSTTIFFTDISTNSQSAITNWQWVFSNGDTSLVQNPTIALIGSQIINVALTIFSDDGCIDSLSLDIPIALIDLDLQDTIVSCPGIEVPLNPGGNINYEYNWTPATGLSDPNSANPFANPDQTTTYTVMVSDPALDTCQLVRDITVVVPPIMELQVSNDTVICGTEITLNAQSPQATEYIWSNVPSFNSIIGNGPQIVSMPGESTIYYVRAMDAFGCIKEDTITVSSHDVKVTVPDYSLCNGDTLQIIPVNNDVNDELTFFWTPEFEIIGDNEIANALVSPTETQTYTAIVINQFGCVDTINSTVTIFDYVPPLFATADPDTLFVGETSQLDATDSLSYTYFWTPTSTLDDPNINNPIATPTETTTYELYIQNEDGCPNKASVRVVVVEIICEDPYVFFPTAFTPNGDGENDYLKIYGTYIEEVYWVIYNRWGQKVYEANEITDEWDGTFNGEELHTDVFGFYLEVRCVDGNEYSKKGNVTLLR